MGKSFLKDFSWYFLGSLIPIVIGVLKTPIFTRHFNQEEFGHLGIITVTFSYLGMILFAWIGTCIWRYQPKYKLSKLLNELYSNILFLFVIALLILFVIVIIWHSFENSFLMKNLILFSFIQLIFSQLYSYYMIVVRIEGRAVFYTIFQSLRAVLSFITVLTLVFIFKVDITALILSLVIIDFVAVLYLFIFNPLKVVINFKLTNKKYLKELLIYGSTGLLINICFLTISSSDRYIISWFGSINDVGVYDQVYKISQLSIAAFVTIFFNTINPTLLNELERNFENSKYLMRSYLKVFFIYGFPAIVYLSFFAKEISDVLLGKEFRIGYNIIPFVFFAAFLHGAINFFELRLKFKDKLKKLSLIMIGATILNIILTIIFVSRFGYKWAAVTTTITYVVIFGVFLSLDRDILFYSSKEGKNNFKFLLVFVVQFLIYFSLNEYFEFTILNKIFTVLIFAICYIFLYKNQFRSLKLILK